MRRVQRSVVLSGLVSLGLLQPNCGDGGDTEHTGRRTDDITLDPATGVPYAFTFQFPIVGFDTSNFGFGFGSQNTRFCLQAAQGSCQAYGHHLARDTRVPETPYGTEVVAPADGIVRISTNVQFGGYGSDTPSNPAYKGCALVLEHEFPNGQPVTTLLGHLACESQDAYVPEAKTGNPPIGALVHRGQYIGHVNHYWAGPDKTTDWHHLHWGMRKGAFQVSAQSAYVRGYAKKEEFTIDPTTGIWTHSEWLDPFVIVAANGDPAWSAGAAVRHHPSGCLLEDATGGYWLVVNDKEIAAVPPEVMASDRFDPEQAIRVSDEELACYTVVSPLKTQGPVTLYQRPNSATVVMAYPSLAVRYDVIRWEALLSWGYDASDLLTDQFKIQFLESSYTPKGFRLLRPGTLVKADEESEVAIVTQSQTRLPIASAEVFEALGFAWERVVSVPASVLTDVAGPRESQILDLQAIHACAVPPSCPSADGSCGGGRAPQADAGASQTEICNGLDDDGNGKIDEIFLCSLGSKGNGCVTSCNTAGVLLCVAPSCAWGVCQPYAEDCQNTLDDDCNGLVDCADEACSAFLKCQSPKPGNGLTLISFVYTGPVVPGLIHVDAWWQPPNAPVHLWSTIAECVDTSSGDGKLNCSFSLPSGTAPFEFQIMLPDGRVWGDKSCSPKGGCGATIGSLIVSGPNGNLPYTLVPNNPNGDPYYNGHIDSIP